MARRYFITGTDTEVGKTYTTVALIKALRRRGVAVAAYKPVAAGAEMLNGELCNEDAAAIFDALGGALPIEKINPLLLAQPIAPSIAAKQTARSINSDELLAGADALDTAEVLLIEGAGGWTVPLTDHYRFDDLAVDLKAEVILVVGLRLGCINHALLTASAISNAGVRIKGWVANHLSPDMPYVAENLDELTIHLKMPPIAVLPYADRDAAIASFDDLVL